MPLIHQTRQRAWNDKSRALAPAAVPREPTSTGASSAQWRDRLYWAMRNHFDRYGEAERDMPDFYSANGCEVVCLRDGRTAHAVAEFMLGKAETGDIFRIGAYSFDHPTVAGEMTYAVRSGATVMLTINYEEIYGRTNSIHGKSVLRKVMQECDSAGGVGQLTARAQKGYDQLPVHHNYNRTLGKSRETVGYMHAKAMYHLPYLLLGSANWSVSTEANRELACPLKVDGAAAALVERYMDRIEKNARIVHLSDLVEDRSRRR